MSRMSGVYYQPCQNLVIAERMAATGPTVSFGSEKASEPVQAATVSAVSSTP